MADLQDAEQASRPEDHYTADEAIPLVGATVRALESIDGAAEPIEVGDLGTVTRLRTATSDDAWRLHVEWHGMFKPAAEYTKHDVDTGRLEIVANGPTPRVCRRCGCTFRHACPGGCSWTTGDICSSCVESPEASA